MEEKLFSQDPHRVQEFEKQKPAKQYHKVPVKEETGILKELLDEDAEKKELKKVQDNALVNCLKKEFSQENQETVESVNGEDYGIDSLWHAQRILEKTLGYVDGYQSDDGILEHKAAIGAVKKVV